MEVDLSLQRMNCEQAEEKGRSLNSRSESRSSKSRFHASPDLSLQEFEHFRGLCEKEEEKILK
jgi:hypothetical protein